MTLYDMTYIVDQLLNFPEEYQIWSEFENF